MADVTAKTVMAAALIAMALIILFAGLKARAHDAPSGWSYDSACCAEVHCHPVADGIVEDTRDGVRVQGYAIVPYSDPMLHWSRDNQDHVCTNGSVLLCVYRKPRDM